MHTSSLHYNYTTCVLIASNFAFHAAYEMTRATDRHVAEPVGGISWTGVGLPIERNALREGKQG